MDVDPLAFVTAYIMSYAAVMVLVVGVGYRVFRWATIPVPLKIPTTPGPYSYAGVAGRIGSEVLLFRSLFAADRKLWVGGWLFHVMFLITIVGHIINLAFNSLWGTIGYLWYDLLGYAGIALLGFTGFLLARRFLVDYIRFVSKFADYFILVLLLGVIFTGNYTRVYSGVGVDEVPKFISGLATFQFVPPPDNLIFTLHLLLVEMLMIYLPFSKVIHAAGVFLSPTRNQRNTPRQTRHVNPWDHQVRIQTWEEYSKLYEKELKEAEAGRE
jgi:nitrate reductase gamma subunit